MLSALCEVLNQWDLRTVTYCKRRFKSIIWCSDSPPPHPHPTRLSLNTPLLSFPISLEFQPHSSRPATLRLKQTLVGSFHSCYGCLCLLLSATICLSSKAEQKLCWCLLCVEHSSSGNRDCLREDTHRKREGDMWVLCSEAHLMVKNEPM